MPDVVQVCTICGEIASIQKDDVVIVQQAFEEKPLLWAHAKCQSNLIKKKISSE
jgi:hypothetical protein